MSIVYAHTPSPKYMIWCPTARFQTHWCNAGPDTFSFYCFLTNSATMLKQYKVKNQSAIFKIPILCQENQFYTTRKLQRLYLLCIRLYPCVTSNPHHRNRNDGELHCACTQPAQFLFPCIWIYVPYRVDSSG